MVWLVFKPTLEHCHTTTFYVLVYIVMWHLKVIVDCDVMKGNTAAYSKYRNVVG
jgi:hypothetical protein